MNQTNEEMKQNIEEVLAKHDKIGLLYYRIDDTYITKKWGNYANLEAEQERLFNRYAKAGMMDEAESLILLPLPKDVDVVYGIIHCGSLRRYLQEHGLIPPATV